MNTRVLSLALAATCLASCAADSALSRNSNTGPGAVSGSPTAWSAGTGGFGSANRDAGSSLRGSGMGAGTSGSTGTGWIEKPSSPQQ